MEFLLQINYILIQQHAEIIWHLISPLSAIKLAAESFVLGRLEKYLPAHFRGDLTVKLFFFVETANLL